MSEATMTIPTNVRDRHVELYGSEHHGRQIDGLLARIDTRLAGFNRLIALIGVVAILVTALIQTLDVIVMRAIFSSPLTGINEIFSTVFPVSIAAVLAAGLSQRATLEVDMMAGILSPRAVRYLRGIGAVLYLGALVLIFWGVTLQAQSTLNRGTYTILNEVPVGPFYAAVALLFLLTIPTQLVVALRLALETHARWPVAIALVFVPGVLILAFFTWIALSFGAYFMGNMVASMLAIVALIWVLIFTFVPVAATLTLCSILGVALIFGVKGAVATLGSETMTLLSSYDIAVVPFFLIMGGLAVRSGMAADIYNFASALSAPFRGGLALGTIGGCAGFGALTGSSVATVATIGKAAFPEMKSRGYSPLLSSGVIAAGGTLGQLVPPSTVVVIYAMMTEQSIGLMYAAIFVPALITIMLYIIAVFLFLAISPNSAPSEASWDAREILRCGWRAQPAVIMFVVIFGGMFAGIFTASEAAAVGAVFAALVLVLRKSYRLRDTPEIVAEVTSTTSMIYMLMIGGFASTFFFSATGLPELAARSIGGLPVPGWVVVSLICLAFLVIGTIMDSIAVMMVTASVTASIVSSLGYDVIWWGVVMVVIVELGVITPPFGLNLFALKSVAPEITIRQIYGGVLPFVAADILKLVLLIAFPALALWLPSLM
ncbi:TRAP transporter large permease subunit [Sulfitobacter sp. G21635-S1]|uniref:TRAP transporter large permease n=1 Tax=Sulfitobacter sp. G21635-S1 TaxID=3014043 RepID=UPI0022B05F11|nr:TRAP transporter large permease subunit [Sulfitobacter sp. G21635-S1]MCZ4256692.1 TRAP transporter large permease subunit [Sulfitobacter sp. G21635-S1]